MADILLTADFDDSGAESALDRLGRSFERLERTSSTRGLRQVEFGLQSLAARATGVEGPLGRVAEGLLAIGGGGEVVIAAAAGLALIGGAMHAMEEAGAGAESALLKVNAAVAAMAKAPFSQLNIQVGDLEKKLEKISNTGFTLGEGFSLLAEGILNPLGGSQYTQAHRSTRLAEAAGLQTSLGIATLSIPDVLRASENAARDAQLKRLVDAFTFSPRFSDSLEAGRFARTVPGFLDTGVRGLNAAGRASVLSGGADFEKRFHDILAGLQTPLEKMQEETRILQQAIDQGRDSSGQAAEGIKRLAVAMDEASGIASKGADRFNDAFNFPTRGSKQGSTEAVRLLGAGFGAIGDIKSQGAAGILSGAGGILSQLAVTSPQFAIPAAIAQGLGGLISLFGKKQTVTIDGYSGNAISQQKQIMEAMSGRLGAEIGIILAPGSTKADAIARLGAQSRSDGISRIPPGAS